MIMTEKEALGVIKRLIGISPSERILSAFGIVKYMRNRAKKNLKKGSSFLYYLLTFGYP